MEGRHCRKAVKVVREAFHTMPIDGSGLAGLFMCMALSRVVGTQSSALTTATTAILFAIGRQNLGPNPRPLLEPSDGLEGNPFHVDLLLYCSRTIMRPGDRPSRSGPDREI